MNFQEIPLSVEIIYCYAVVKFPPQKTAHEPVRSPSIAEAPGKLDSRSATQNAPPSVDRGKTAVVKPLAKESSTESTATRPESPPLFPASGTSSASRQSEKLKIGHGIISNEVESNKLPGKIPDRRTGRILDAENSK
jgi:hypothetical protein